MESYKKILQKIIDTGEWKENRTGIRCLTTTPQFFEHNMADGFPLLTTKKMGLQNISAELEFFIKGLTDKSWLQERGCRIWDEWASPQQVENEWNDTCVYTGDFSPMEQEDKLILQRSCNDLGPIYGYQWRNFNKTYTPYQDENDGDYNSYTDQLKSAVDTLKTNPNDRRLVVSAWNPNQKHLMALPPCHLMFILQHINGKLSLNWVQRSVDSFLGLGYNISSYAMLLLLICKETGLTPGMLSANLVDCHIYENHMDQVKLQLTRDPYPLPTVSIPDKGWRGIFNWEYKDFVLENYEHHPRIKAPVAV